MRYPQRIISLVVIAMAALWIGVLPLEAGDRDRDGRRSDSHWRRNDSHSRRSDSHWRNSRRDYYRHDHYRDRGRYYRDRRYVSRPRTQLSFSFGTGYHAPLYGSSLSIYSHRYYGPRYGTIVTRLPLGCERIYVGRRTYYHFNNVYYAPSATGYVVVNPATIVYDSAPTPAETREAVRRAMSSADLTIRESETSPAPDNTPEKDVAPLEYLPSGYRTHYVNGAPVYEVEGRFYRWSPERHAYIATPAPVLE